MQWLSILHTIAKGVKGKGRLYITYEQDIVCLRKWFGKELIHIPRKKAVWHLLAKNKLVGKVQLKSHMNEEKNFMEICSVFCGPMGSSSNSCSRVVGTAGLSRLLRCLSHISGLQVQLLVEIARHLSTSLQRMTCRCVIK